MNEQIRKKSPINNYGDPIDQRDDDIFRKASQVTVIRISGFINF